MLLYDRLYLGSRLLRDQKDVAFRLIRYQFELEYDLIDLKYSAHENKLFRCTILLFCLFKISFFESAGHFLKNFYLDST